VVSERDALAAYEAWADAWVARHLEIVAQDIKRRDPRKLAVARRQRMERRDAALLPAFRRPLPTVEELTAEYQARDTPKETRRLIDPIFRPTFLSAWRWRERARPRLTKEQFESLEAARERIYPLDPVYTVDFWRSVVYALVWCPEPVLEPRLALHAWLGHGDITIRELMDSCEEEEPGVRQMTLAEAIP
jgi:hypothetical protein